MMQSKNYIESLISKYIDGELSFDQDQELRELVATDQDFKRIYQNSLNIHLAIKEDSDNIKLPQNLESATEDLILMKIFSQAPTAKMQKRKISAFSYRNFSIAACLFLMFNLFKISDNGLNNVFSTFSFSSNNLELGKSNSFDISKPLSTKNTKKQIKVPSISLVQNFANNEEISSNKIENNVNESFGNGSKVIEDNLTNSTNLNVNQNIVVNKETKISNEDIPNQTNSNETTNIIGGNSDKKLNSFSNNISTNSINGLNNPNPGEFNNNLNQKQGVQNLNLDQNLFNYSDIKDVQLTTLYSQAFDNSNRVESANLKINHFIQSIAYSISDTKRFGFEGGVTEMTFNDLTIRTLPNNPPTAQNKAIEISPNSDLGIRTLIEKKSNHTIYWGSAFFETEVYKIQSLDITFQTRVGFGTSSDGLLGYGRLIAKYQVFDFLNLTAGLETRYMALDIPSSYKLSDNGISTNAFFYGIQFKF